MCKIADIINRKNAELDGSDPELSPNDLTFFKFTPVTTYYVEQFLKMQKSTGKQLQIVQI